MKIHLGIDVGAVSVNAALVLPQDRAQTILGNNGSGNNLRLLESFNDEEFAVLVAPYCRTKGRPLEAVVTLIWDLLERLEGGEISSVMFTGSGGALVARALEVPRCNEFQALARAVDLLHPEVRTVFEIGGESSKYLRLEPDAGCGRLGILDYSTNGDCAAGTGAFLDQQAGRLQYQVEDIGSIVSQAERTAQIAGRCSVFAKSDMIHAQQKGFNPPEVLRGLCKAVSTNYKSAVVKGRTPKAPIVFVGGVTANSAVVRELKDVFNLEDGSMFVPPTAASMAAIGAAVVAWQRREYRGADLRRSLTRIKNKTDGNGYTFAASLPLNLDRVLLLRDRVRPYELPDNGGVIDAYLGLDIGSVGTKLVAVDDNGDVIHDIFTRTEGRPIEVVSRILKELRDAVGSKIRVRGVGSTGSGRELIGELVGADSIIDEIACHKTGAAFVGDRLLGKRPDTTSEIGGQDSKYISLQPEGGGSNDTIVVDFTMNEACAAGTGSFLEERAEELGVSIKDEFSKQAFSSQAPVKLGERCTVFMERDVNTAMQRGARRADVIAGLAYSVVYNYINRVVRGRHIGDCIFLQGGTAYNDAVAAAFSVVCDKEIIVPPHNAVLGAIGAALLAKEKVTATGRETQFRGYDIDEIDYTLREFSCKGCGNLCSVQEFKVEDEKTYWGDKCSDRYRKKAKTDIKPIIPDLVSLRNELLNAGDGDDPAGARQSIGIPLAMYSYDLLPLWRRFFRDCGFKVVVSDPTNRSTVQRGGDSVVAEPCFPIIVAHGHVAELIDKGVDYLWVPNVMSAQTKFMDNQSHMCPWGQTLPFVVRHAPGIKSRHDRVLCPTIHLRAGSGHLRQVLVETVKQLGVPKRVARKAFESALKDLEKFRYEYEKAGLEAMGVLLKTGASGMVVVGRPYNIHDQGVSLSVARKLRDYYGVNVIPIDALPLADVDIVDINENMYWDYGRRILAAAKIVAQHPNLHIIYITNFKCGPDSFIKGFVRSASGKPFLSLQFDGHSNDAGMMTRCEAYLDSKGILRWWRKSKKQKGRHLRDESYTSPRWSMREPDFSRQPSDRSV